MSFSSGVNVVDVGMNIDEHLASLEYQRPMVWKLTVYIINLLKLRSVSGFIISLLEAVAIVIVVLLLLWALKVVC